MQHSSVLAILEFFFKKISILKMSRSFPQNFSQKIPNVSLFLKEMRINLLNPSKNKLFIFACIFCAIVAHMLTHIWACFAHIFGSGQCIFHPFYTLNRGLHESQPSIHICRNCSYSAAAGGCKQACMFDSELQKKNSRTVVIDEPPHSIVGKRTPRQHFRGLR